jgi:hypothetical protein
MNWQGELQEICQRQPLASEWGTLYTVGGEYVRSATKAEWEESEAERALFGPFGWIHIRACNQYGYYSIKKCYVLGGPPSNFGEYV